MSLVSVSGYAKLHGVSKGAAQKWQTRGLLRFRDGKVDVEASDQMLAHAGVGRFADAATKQRRTATSSRSQVAAPVAVFSAAIADGLEDAAAQGDEDAKNVLDFMAGLAEGRAVDLITAQTMKENGLAAVRIIEARKRAGEVIEFADAEAIVFEMFRRQRDAWMNFPSKVGPLIAADLGVSPERVLEVLTAHVHQQLTDLGEPIDPLGETRPTAADRQKGSDPAAKA
ncbi:MAG: hypothetical protein DI531_15480 [Brevundimonas sp.]|uniref:hypothetical protein n=1 Tax=Brevundimonas sp. TaxID=1871086 RepID=UPI000DB64FCF|nr:hypothetical protein [Brevundimonas sp.]PZU71664.1 MAG: hypothetical protein DI531_15480 [Brevundimonas sp.]